MPDRFRPESGVKKCPMPRVNIPSPEETHAKHPGNNQMENLKRRLPIIHGPSSDAEYTPSIGEPSPEGPEPPETTTVELPENIPVPRG